MGPYDKEGSPQKVWKVTRVEQLRRLIAVLSNSRMPAKKARELALFTAAVDVKSHEGVWAKAHIDGRLLEIAALLSEAKGYQSKAAELAVVDPQMDLFDPEA